MAKTLSPFVRGQAAVEERGRKLFSTATLGRWPLKTRSLSENTTIYTGHHLANHFLLIFLRTGKHEIIERHGLPRGTDRTFTS